MNIRQIKELADEYAEMIAERYLPEGSPADEYAELAWMLQEGIEDAIEEYEHDLKVGS